MLRMQNVNGTMQPVFICDVCVEPIKGKGMALSDRAAPGETVPLYYLHDHADDMHPDCEKQFLESHPVLYRDMAEGYALGFHAIHITRSLGLTSLDQLGRLYFDLKAIESPPRLAADNDDLDDEDLDEEL